MAILDNAFPESPDFHDFTEEKLQDDIRGFISSPTIDIPLEIYDYVSPLRRLLFEWYPFKEGGRILEIGGNVGELTEFFCEAGSSVFSIEPNDAKREIIQQRCEKYGNLRVENILFKEIPKLGAFDYIIIHNYFGYLKKYFCTSDTYVDFFKMLYSSLSPAGKILVATNNRIGLKYLSGAVEEYTGKMYSGINGFDGYNKVRTFTKMELTDILEKAGIRQYKFYYPFPDYVFPTEIHTSESLKYFVYDGERFSTNYEMPALFDTRKLAQTLQAENVIETFADSFLVELSDEKVSDVLYYKPYLKMKRHNGGCTICGDSLEEAVIYYTGMPEERRSSDIMYSEKERVKFCWGSQWEMPSSVRLKEKLLCLLNSCIREDRTEDLCKEVCRLWKRVACAIRGLQQETTACGSGGYDVRSLCSNDRLYVQENGTICILWPSSSLSYVKDNCEYVIWSLIYSWYTTEVLTCKSYRSYISIAMLYEECGVDIESVRDFREALGRLDNRETDEKDILSHACAEYEMGMSDPIQIFMQGEPVIKEASDIRHLDAHQKILAQAEMVSEMLLQ